jgi:hypothetical protein
VFPAGPRATCVKRPEPASRPSGDARSRTLTDARHWRRKRDHARETTHPTTARRLSQRRRYDLCAGFVNSRSEMHSRAKPRKRGEGDRGSDSRSQFGRTLFRPADGENGQTVFTPHTRAAAWENMLLGLPAGRRLAARRARRCWRGMRPGMAARCDRPPCSDGASGAMRRKNHGI